MPRNRANLILRKSAQRRALDRLHATIALLLMTSIGCGPIYRPPKRADIFRAEPLPVEQTTPLNAAANPYPNASLPNIALNGESVGEAPLPDGAQEQNGSRPIALEDAIQQGLGSSGVVRVVVGVGGTVAAATFFDPAINEALARATLAAFDPSFTSALYANWIKQPPDAIFGPGLAEPTLRDEAGYTAAFTKRWITGAESRIGYNPPLGYLWLPDGSSSFNPLYTSNTEFSLKQPLLKGAGIAVNKAPIRIAHLRRDQSIYETKQAAMASVRSITEAYWDLQAATAAAQAIDEVVPMLERVVHIEQERLNAQRSVRADVAKVESQLRAVRQQGIQARSAVVQRELLLRNVLGLPPNDGSKLMPTSQPLRAPVTFDPAASSDLALQIRPDLIRQRLVVRTRETELLAVKNTGLPQLDAIGLYRLNGVGQGLDDSINQMVGTQYHDWQTSLAFSMPLGRRAAAANIRAANVQLCREKAILQQVTHNALHQLNSLTQEAEYTYGLYAEADARLRANAEWLEGAKVRYENPPPAGDGSDWLLAALNDYLLALRSQADAATNAQTFLARYNALLARLNEARGTILTDYNVEWTRGEFVDPQAGCSPADASAPVEGAVNTTPLQNGSTSTPSVAVPAPGAQPPQAPMNTAPFSNAPTTFGPGQGSTMGPQTIVPPLPMQPPAEAIPAPSSRNFAPSRVTSVMPMPQIAPGPSQAPVMNGGRPNLRTARNTSPRTPAGVY